MARVVEYRSAGERLAGLGGHRSSSVRLVRTRCAVPSLQVVGITADEFAAAQGGRAAALLERIAPYLPLWVTDTARASLIV